MLEYQDLSGNGKGIGFVNRALTSESISGLGATSSARVHGDFNVSLSGTFVATFRLERSYDNGINWSPMTALGSSIEFTGPCEEIFSENEHGVLYRWNCVQYYSGTAICRISQ